MNKRIILGLILIIMMTCFIATQMDSNEIANASAAPSIEIEEQDKIIVKEKGQTTFDVNSLFTIQTGSFTESQLTIGYTINRNESIVEHDDLVIDFVEGDYTLTILIIGNGVNIGAPIMQNVTFSLDSLAPTFFNAESMEEVKSLNIQKNQGFIDLRVLYRVIGNSFDDNEWSISYDVRYPGRTVEVFGDFIKSISGVYTITYTITSVNGVFEDIVSVPMTIIVQKARPQVNFEYETESGKTMIDGEHTIPIYSGTQYVNLVEYFTIYGNAYVENEYAYSLIVKKENGQGGYDNCQVFDGMIAPNVGTYTVVVKVNPKIQGAFTPVVSDTITLYVIKAIPKVNQRDSLYIQSYDGKRKEINLSDVVSVSNSAYSPTQYTVSYSFEKDGKIITDDDGKVNLANGEWNVVSTVTSNDELFEPQVTEFTMIVDVPMSTTSIVLLIVIPVIAIGLALIAFMIIRKRKNESFNK